MIMLGEYNWYLPRWLDRILPHLSIEGADYFKTHEQRATEPSREPAAR